MFVGPHRVGGLTKETPGPPGPGEPVAQVALPMGQAGPEVKPTRTAGRNGFLFLLMFWFGSNVRVAAKL